MKKKIIPFTLVITGFLIGATALSVMAQTWTAPTCSPPNCNISAPVLTGSSVSPINLQTRYGALQISGNFGIAGNLIYNPGGTITQGEVLTANDANGTAVWAPASGSSGGVSQITAGTNVTISPTTGLGNVTVNASPAQVSVKTVSDGSAQALYNTQTTVYQASCPSGDVMTGWSMNAAQNLYTINCATLKVTVSY